VHAERAARLGGAGCVQDGAQCGDALLSRRWGAVKERLKECECLATTIWDRGDSTEESMRREEIGADHLCAAAAASPTNATLQCFKCGARLSLRRWARRRVTERLGDGDGPVESLGNLLGDLCGTWVGRISDRNDSNL
jgi:hypothetical protein